VSNNDPSQDMAERQNIKQAAGKTGKKPPKKITEKYLYNSGLAYLQRFTSSVPNFRRVMMRKIEKSCNFHKDQDREACVALLDAAVATFERQGLLNDTAYTQGMVTSLRRRGLSARAIQAKLQQKGLDAGSIAQAVAAFDGGKEHGQAELMAAVQYARRKRLGCFGKAVAGDEADKTRNRQMASLARAGFSYDVTEKTLALSEEDAEELLRRSSY